MKIIETLVYFNKKCFTVCPILPPPVSALPTVNVSVIVTYFNFQQTKGCGYLNTIPVHCLSKINTTINLKKQLTSISNIFSFTV